jgi:Peptidase family M28
MPNALKLFAYLLFLITWIPASAQNSPDRYFHPDSLRQIVNALAHDSMNGRFTGSNGERLSAGYIADKWKKAGLWPLFDSTDHQLEFEIVLRDTLLRSRIVTGLLTGREKADEIIIFSAHYDHVGTRKTNPYEGMLFPSSDQGRDTIYNGANDDASGVAALIALSRYYAECKCNSRTLLFLAFSGEELGLKGSTFFSELVKPENIVTVINIEMIGRGGLRNGNRPFVTGAEKSDLIDLLNKELKNNDYKAYRKEFYFRRDPYSGFNLFERSDNYPFARKGIPAHTLMFTSPEDPYYHSVNDEANTLNYEDMSIIVKGIALGMGGIVEGRLWPKR